jgi:hypothetical protein
MRASAAALTLILILILPIAATAQQSVPSDNAVQTPSGVRDVGVPPPQDAARIADIPGVRVDTGGILPAPPSAREPATAVDALSPGVAYPTEPAQDEAATAGFDHGFYLRSADGAFVFRPFGLIHVDVRVAGDGRQINTDDTQAATFVVRRLRFGFEGQLHGSIAYDLEANVGSGGAELIYAWMNFGHVPHAQVRLGQFEEPFSYEVLLPETSLDFIERSIVATVVSPAEDIGVMVHNLGTPVRGIFEYGIGMFNGIGVTAEKTDPDKTFEYTGRVAVYPFAASSTSPLKGIRVAAYALFEGNRPSGALRSGPGHHWALSSCRGFPPRAPESVWEATFNSSWAHSPPRPSTSDTWKTRHGLGMS